MISGADSSETMLRDAFTRVVGDEPPMGIDAHALIEARRRASHHRLVYRSAAVAAVVATATAAFATTVHRSDGTRRAAATSSTAKPATRPAFRLTSATGRVALPVASDPKPSGALDAKIVAAISASSPSGFTFDFGGGGTNAVSVDGTADDGHGPGRLYVYAGLPGMFTREPCGDPEFAAGATCTETRLAGDAILSVRGLVDYQGIETIEVSLTHADGSGVGAEVGNFTLPPFPRGPKTRDQLIEETRPTITRPAPTYNADQIAAVVEAVDTAIHGS